jgi:large subunit ribosomal protein L28
MLTFLPFPTASAAVARDPHPEPGVGHPRRSTEMAAVCEICGKKPSFGMSLSHSHRRTKRRWDPNIQRVRALVDGTPRRLNVCTSCIRAGRVTKPPRRVPTAG